MSKFTKIFIYSFVLFIAFSVLGNILFANIYNGIFIFITYVLILLGITFAISPKDIFRVLGFFGGISIIGYILLYPVKDGSWDGSAYHLEIIWNFIHGQSFLSTNSLDLWSHVYPKNQEILLSIFASLDTTYTDLGRIIKFILIGVVTLVVYNFTHKSYPHLRTYGIIFIIFGIFLHPLVLSQAFTKYIDDMLYLFFIIYIIGFLSREYWIALLMVALFIGSKLNYVIYVGLSLPLLLILASKLRNISWKDILGELWYDIKTKRIQFFIVLSIGSIIASYIYLINIYNYHNPVYPLLGTNKIEVVSNNLPVNLIDVPKPVAHFYSFFSYALSNFTQDAYLMNPFSRDFLHNIVTSYKNIEVDTRMSGFGTLWSILFFISLLHIPFLFHRYWKIISIVGVTLVGILMFMPFAWARFIPFFYLIPLIIGLGLPMKYRRYYLTFFFTLFILNIGMYTGSYYGRYYVHNGVQNLVTEYYLKKNDIQIVGYFPGMNQKSDKKKISYKTQHELYHLTYEIPTITKDQISQHCSNDSIEELFNKGSGMFDVFQPMVVSCGGEFMLVRTRGYLYRDMLLAHQ